MTTLSGIADRLRISAGTAFLPGNSWLVGATFPADVVRAARIQVQEPDGSGRAELLREGEGECLHERGGIGVGDGGARANTRGG